MKSNVSIYVTVISFFIVFLFLFLWYYEQDIPVAMSQQHKEQLKQQGVCLVSNFFTMEEIQKLHSYVNTKSYKQLKNELMNHTKLLNNIRKCTYNSDYVLQDYMWVIEKSFVHTCHRDNNGDMFNDGQLFPSYTMIIYLENMNKCLHIYPESHNTKYGIFDPMITPIQTVYCKKGDVILFNANLIHSGTFSKNENNIRIQMKVTHPKDRQLIGYYEDFQKVISQENTIPRPIRKLQHHMSCLFPGISDTTQDKNIQSSRGTSQNAIVSPEQRAFSFFFYGDTNYFDLPNEY